MPQTPTKLPATVNWSEYALFLDFDGTLAPIVSRPEDVSVGSKTHQALSRLKQHTNGALAIISGRALDDLMAHLAPTTCAMSGSHGLEMMDADGGRFLLSEAVDDLSHPRDILRSFGQRHDLIVEDKPGAVTVHYRNAPQLAEDARSLVDELSGGNTALRGMHGNMVSEVALAGVDKGAALLRFMATPPFAGRSPIMAGDDVTDEDAFTSAQDLGGIGIKIGRGQTGATHRAADIAIFLRWLCQVAERPGG